MRLTIPLAIMSTTLTVATVADAASDNLYPPPPPPGAASVRVVDVRADARPAAISIGSTSITTAAQPSPFKYVNQGQVPVKSPGAARDAAISAGQFYTVMVGNKTTAVFQEEKPPLTQSLIVLYNLSLLESVTLKTDDGTATVVGPQRRFSVGSRPVNPVKAGFSVYQGDRKIGSVSAVQLQRGASFGVFVTGPASNPRIVVAPGPSLAS